MAPVTRGPRDRAQLLLVGGLVIAVGLVALAIVLNSGIYTHNLASRADPTASEAVGNAAVVRDGVAGLVDFAVRHHPDDTAAQVHNVTAAVPDVSEQASRGWARHAVFANATVATTANGTTVNQTGDREFTDSASAAHWTVASDARGVRAFEMDVIRTSLADEGGLLPAPLSASVFNVTVDPDSGSDLNVSVYRDGSGSTAVLVTEVDTGRTFGPCTDDTGTRTTVDLTGATVGDEYCGALERVGEVDRPFDVAYSSANSVAGSYSLVVNTTSVSPNVVAPGTPGPTAFDTLYSAGVDVRFNSQRVDYRTTIRVAPGEAGA